ncbi:MULTISPECIES: beta-ketoacyl-[acyl-carrier-protein] synthase family protein [Glycomyces]|uniref:3-oxoacyl-[acyl-carrier-protein] synthase II n=2 Tax=Glycomyces TaxID=58113 RepID=A0A9X3SW07_9ACTN|nr:beta-ketoacyl-[acyl-carrier-protein] synthase family protein [Glycomyces lechevalierae]MDA1383416.1 beta-ketoacyl-[acyl-carrier-protein] synthase family protein [Glycomyces lechevalierae]MDR7336422.1 3-oxoacyl-[acyl-carrier-protein] synthase II [Glycomyces lechevalierae]
MSARRVAITGLGPVSPIGTGRAAFAEALLAGRSGRRPVTAFDPAGFQIRHGCEVPDFDPAAWLERLDPAATGRGAAFAVAAARLALADAGLDPAGLRGAAVLIAMGTSDTEAQEEDRLAVEAAAGGPAGFDSATAARYTGGTAVQVARDLNLPGAEPVDLSAACAAGNHAIAHSLDAIRMGDADIALCGGSDSFSRRMFASFHRVGTLAPDACRPFDADRAGTVVGEGAGVLVLEALDRALARGARIIGEVAGAASNCDARHPVAPDTASVAECIRLAHLDAGIEPSQVDAICAHGTGTPVNDVNEARSIRKVFGDAVPPVVAVKSMLGHAMGASAALGAIAAAVALDAQFLPPTVNHRRTDPECDVDCVPNTGRPAALRVVENHGFGFGGSNAVVLIAKAAA